MFHPHQLDLVVFKYDISQLTTLELHFIKSAQFNLFQFSVLCLPGASKAKKIVRPTKWLLLLLLLYSTPGQPEEMGKVGCWPGPPFLTVISLCFHQ